MTKFLKFTLIFLTICLLIIIGVATYVAITILQIDKSQMLDLDKLNTINAQIKIYDENDEEIVTTSTNGSKTVGLNDLPEYLPQAFISIEDKNFYKHNGLNYGRIVKAGIKNIFSGYAKEGASTITQQLIKNTHLSSEKTMSRKIQEAYLSLKLEKQYDKDKILETYLNVIYFGNGAYGIESAAETFFNKSASELNLAESATLAGLIKSPRTYSPINNSEKCVERRNLVLLNMYEDEKISKQEYEEAISTPLSVVENTNHNSTLNKQVVDEAMDILDLSEKDISTSGLRIYTYLNKNIQNEILEIYNTDIENAIIVINNKNNSIVSYIGNCQQKRPAGSTLKPILCYAPALEKGLLSPATPINDSKITFGDYTPKNANNKFLGWTNVRTALAKSLNIPAIKTLEYVGVNNAQKFANKVGLTFDKEDNHLAIALGATKYGFSMEEIANVYSSFARNGLYDDLKLIKEIKDANNKVIYKAKNNFKQQISAETSYLINDMLKDSITIGTARKLSNLGLNLCAKTGTVGSTDGNTNTDAWCVSYTPEYTVLSWFGNTSGDNAKNLLSTQNGGTISAKQSNKIWQILKQHFNLNKDFERPETVVDVKLDGLSLKSQKLELATESTPECYIVEDIFNKKYIPKTISSNFDIITAPVLSMQKYKEKLYLTWEGLEYLKYEIHQIINNKDTILNVIDGKNDTLEYTIDLPNAESEFYLISKYKNQNLDKSVISERVKYIPETSTSNSGNVFTKIYKKWFK